MITTACPTCSSQVALDDPAQLNTQVECPKCKATFIAVPSQPPAELREPELDDEGLSPDFDQTTPWVDSLERGKTGAVDRMTAKSRGSHGALFCVGLVAGVAATMGVIQFLGSQFPGKSVAVSQRVPEPSTLTQLKESGAFGFPQSEATILCDATDLRLSVYNDRQNLFLQAVLWGDGEDGEEVDAQGRASVDFSTLMLDVDADQQRTPQTDRRYTLARAPSVPGLCYALWLDATRTTESRFDTKGGATTTYLDAADGQRVRVDSFVIPLAEIGRVAGDRIRLAYYAYSATPRLRVNSLGFAPGTSYYSHSLPQEKYHDVMLVDRPGTFLDSVLAADGRTPSQRSPTGLPASPSHDEAATKGKPAPAVSEPAAQVSTTPGLKEAGAFGFPQSEATVLCDEKELRLSVWNDRGHLFVQAVVWNDDQDGVESNQQGQKLCDQSTLELDVDANQQRTPQVDRRYTLNPVAGMLGLHYQVYVNVGASFGTTGLQSNSRGGGAIQYVDAGDGRRARVDTFAIPLPEIGKSAAEKIRLAYYAYSPIPKLRLNSVGFVSSGDYSSGWLPTVSFHEVTLVDRPSSLLGLVLAADGRPRASPPIPTAVAPFEAEQARRHQETWAKYLGMPLEYKNSTGMTFRLIPPGTFRMGGTSQEIETASQELPKLANVFQNESPQHLVTLTTPFYLGVHEVTQRQYVTIARANPSWFCESGGGAAAVAGQSTLSHPVEQVSWHDAACFCIDLSAAERLPSAYLRQAEGVVESPGIGYRLPLEAEWEYACRAGATTRFWSGDTDEQLLQVAWTLRNSGGQTHPVGQRPANPFGLYDMHGNVWEWCQDHGRKYTASAIGLNNTQWVNPNGSATPVGLQRSARGGSARSELCLHRSARRGGQEPTYADEVMGFRLVLPVEAVRQLVQRKKD